MGSHPPTNPTIHPITHPTAEPDSYPDTSGHTSGHQVTDPVTGRAVHPATDSVIYSVTHRAIDPNTHQDATSQPITAEKWHPFTEIQGRILFNLITAGGRTSRDKISKETGIKLASIKRTTALLAKEGYICNIKVYYGHNERGFTYYINQAVCAEFIARVTGKSIQITSQHPILHSVIDSASHPVTSPSHLHAPLSSKVLDLKENLTTKPSRTSLLDGDLELAFWKAEGVTDRQFQAWLDEFQLEAEELSTSLKYARFEILEQEKKGDIKKSAQNWFYKIMQRTGFYPRPAQYSSLEEIRAEEILANRKRVEESQRIIAAADLEVRIDKLMTDKSSPLYRSKLMLISEFSRENMSEGNEACAIIELREMFKDHLLKSEEAPAIAKQ